MPVVTNTIKAPGGTPLTGRVSITLVGSNANPIPGYVTAEDRTIAAYTNEAIVAGVWSVTLTANSLINPSGTRYKVVENVNDSTVTYYINVTDVLGPLFVEDILSEAPASIASPALQTHIDKATAAHAASAVGFTPTGDLVSTTVQAALSELDTEKARLVNGKLDPAQSATIESVVVAGNLGAAYTLATAGVLNVTLEGTLNVTPVTVTITGLVAGSTVRMLLNGTVDTSLTITVGASSKTFTVSPRTGAPVTVEVDTPDGTTVYVTTPGAAGPAGPAGPAGSSDPYDPLKFGMAVSDLPGGVAPANFTHGTANRAYFKRLINGKQGATGVRFRVAVAAGNVSVGVYRKSGVGAAAVPGTLLASSGSVACPAAGIATVSLGATVDVEAGDFVAFSCSAGTASFGGLFAGFAGEPVFTGMGAYKETFHPIAGNSPVVDAWGVVGGIILTVV